MNADSQWVCIRLVRKMLIEAGLFDSQTNSVLTARIAAGLLPVKAKKVIYATSRSGTGEEALDDVILSLQILQSLGLAEINFAHRTLKCHTVSGIKQIYPVHYFTAFDVEFGLAEVLDFVGPIACTEPSTNKDSGGSVADTNPISSVVLSAQSGRRPGDGSFVEVDAPFVEMIVQLKIAKKVTSIKAGAEQIWEQYHEDIKGTREAAVTRLRKAATERLRVMGLR